MRDTQRDHYQNIQKENEEFFIQIYKTLYKASKGLKKKKNEENTDGQDRTPKMY